MEHERLQGDAVNPFVHIIHCNLNAISLLYEGVSKSFRIDCLERELQIEQLSATTCSCIAIL
jgi:hypothetical protein